jgi:hypothetical protein
MDGKVVRCFKEEKWVSCQMPCKFLSGCKSKSTDYHDDMNAENEEKEKLIPNLFQNSVVVTENASYHNVQLNRAPTSASRKSEMKEWLMQKNISFEENSYY